MLASAQLLGAMLFAAGLASPVYARMSWLGVLPLLIAVRLAEPPTASNKASRGLQSARRLALQNFNLSEPLKAAILGILWGLGVFAFSLLVLPATAGLPASGALRLVALGAGFCLLGSAVTRRAGFHPFLLAAAWLAVETLLGPRTCEPGTVCPTPFGPGPSTFLAKALGTASLGAILVFVNSALVWAFCELRATFPGRDPLGEIRRAASKRGALLVRPYVPPSMSVGQPRAPP